MVGVEWLVSSIVLSVLILLIRRIFKEKLNARLRYFLWLIVLVRLLVPVSFAGSNVSVLNLMPQNILEGKTDLARENNLYPEYAGDGFVSAENEIASEGKKEEAPVSEPKENAQLGASENASNATEGFREEMSGSYGETAAMPKEKVTWQDIAVMIWAVGMVIVAMSILR